MNRFIALGVIIFISVFCVDASYAAQATATYLIDAINELSVSGDPGPLTVCFAVAGYQPSAEVDNSTSYNITTNGSSKKITGSIDTAMPSNTNLYVNLTAPAGASSSGYVTLSTSALDLVTSISTVAQAGLTITYRLFATTSAGVVAPANRTVTFTLTDGV